MKGKRSASWGHYRRPGRHEELCISFPPSVAIYSRNADHNLLGFVSQGEPVSSWIAAKSWNSESIDQAGLQVGKDRMSVLPSDRKGDGVAITITIAPSRGCLSPIFVDADYVIEDIVVCYVNAAHTAST
jgi:hypothetical protein